MMGNYHVRFLGDGRIVISLLLPDKGHISGGRFFVRKTLYMAALVAAFSNDKMKKKYKELIEKGKAAKVALTAIMRKIIVCLNAMIKNNKLYEI